MDKNLLTAPRGYANFYFSVRGYVSKTRLGTAVLDHLDRGFTRLEALRPTEQKLPKLFWFFFT